MKAILVDVNAKTISEVDAENDDQLKQMIGCRIWQLAIRDGDRDQIQVLVDEEGLFKEGSLPGFTYEGYPGTLVGNAAITQVDDEGNAVDLTDMTLEQARSKISFTTLLDTTRREILDRGPQVIFPDPNIEGSFLDNTDVPGFMENVSKKFDFLKKNCAPRSNILGRFKNFIQLTENNESRTDPANDAAKARLIFLQESLAKEPPIICSGVMRPEGMGGQSYDGNIVSFFGPKEEVGNIDDRPFFLGEPFESVWIESINKPLASVLWKDPTTGKATSVPAYAIWLYHYVEDGYIALWADEDGSPFLASVIGEGVNSSSESYRTSAVHRFLFLLFQLLGRHGQTGTERVNERFKVGTGASRQLVKIKDIVHVRLKSKQSKASSGDSRVIEWSHRWEVMGHWRKTPGKIGKDNRGNYCVNGYTWVVPHTKGPEGKDLVKKTRFVVMPDNPLTIH